MTGGAYTEQALDFFQARAIDAAVAAELGVVQEGAALIFPGGRRRDLNGRTRAKVHQPPGKKLALWWLGEPESTAMICEGETDALAAESALRTAPAAAGLGEITVTAIPGTGFPSKRLVELAEAGVSEAFLAIDNDEAGRKFTGKAVEILSEAGITTIVVELPEGRDVADVLAAADDPGDLLANLLVDAAANGSTGDQQHAEAEAGLVLAPPTAPMAVARGFVATRFMRGDELILRHWRGGWWLWATSCWIEIEHRAVRGDAYTFTENALYAKGKDLEPWDPTRNKIANLLEALAAVCHLPESVAQPTWIDGGHHGLVVACSNGLLDVEDRQLLPHDPRFFNQTAVPFPYEPGAVPPERWLAFLGQLWPDDSDSIAALQEWFGYVISGRLDLHKILLLVGPTRAGKGVIARVLGALIGRDNVAGPTLTSLSGDFGLAPLLGKPLAVISDARMNGRNSQVVVERLLAISGEDMITVNRKYKDQWTGKLPSRFMVISNELPHLGDASAAIAGRFVALLLSRSWLNHEDHALEGALHRELPGILNWSLDGLQRLAATNTFTRPVSTGDAMIALQDLASPVSAFLRDRCTRDLGDEVEVDRLWTAWKSWAEENGHSKSTKQTFGRNLRAAVPHLQVAQPRDGDQRHRVYRGVALRELGA